jgi:predicted RecB family nuclease
MIVSSRLFEAYLECPTKCWLYSRAEQGAGNAYAEWTRSQNEIYYESGLKYLLEIFPKSDRATEALISAQVKEVTWRVASDVCLQINGLESHLQAVERIPPEERGKSSQFIPYRFRFTNKLTNNDKMSLAFDALVLAETVGCEVSFGKIIHGDGTDVLKVNLASLVSEVKHRITDVITLLAKSAPPELVLNPHCPQCEFQVRCRNRAREKDDLSLLSGMSGKERRKLLDKGIFTVTQLSYTFRPRRRQSLGKQERFHHSLRALAIRENKIHAVDILDPKLDGTPVFLDVEGLPDRDFYYLAGIRVGTGNHALQYGFWTNDKDGEKHMWNEFLDILSGIPDPMLIHFGSYETVFFRRMCKRYGGPPETSVAANAIEHAVNLLSLVFAHIYFPTFSNGLKEIAGYLGFRWSGLPASGLEAIVWRHRWEASRDPDVKQALLDYNRRDCEALELVTDRIVDLHRAQPTNGRSSQNNVVLTSEMKREGAFPLRFGRNLFALPELEVINKAAYWDYQRERIYLKSRTKPTRKRERYSRPKNALVSNTIVECSRASYCPNCESNLIYRHGKRSKIEVDLRFMRHGVKRWVTRYIIYRYRCQSCRSTFDPRDRCRTRGKYGQLLAAYTMYQNIELGLPQSRVASSARMLFGLDISRNTVNQFKAATAQIYAQTYNDLLKRLCNGRLLHVDETKASVMGKDRYVWALTSMEEVAYFHAPTREGGTIQAMLKDFSGVLVTDFYAAYDAVECLQQKCLIHFIRDLNDELLKHPYDDALKRVVGDFAGLLKSIVETVERHGLKKRFLGKHRVLVNRFYKHLDGRLDTSEATRKLVDRLQRNRNKMFTFLDFDDVFWNNNNAEHAIKAFASLRRVIEGKSTEKGLSDFLILLSVCETCKYKNVEFLDFLRSGSNNIDDFAISQKKGHLRARQERFGFQPGIRA